MMDNARAGWKPNMYNVEVKIKINVVVDIRNVGYHRSEGKLFIKHTDS